MKRRKMNISLWCLLGIAALLMLFCLMVSTGTTLARYRSETEATIYFEAREPVSVYLGRVEYPEEATESAANSESAEATEVVEGTFVQANEGKWELNEDGKLQLKFAVANGTSEKKYEKRNQRVYIRVLGSLGVQNEGQPVTLTLTYPGVKKQETVTAVAVRIDPESALYATFGDGWIFSFPDQEGEELSWLLEGEALNYIEMDVTIESASVSDTSLLQLQVSSRYVSD